MLRLNNGQTSNTLKFTEIDSFRYDKMPGFFKVNPNYQPGNYYKQRSLLGKSIKNQVTGTQALICDF